MHNFKNEQISKKMIEDLRNMGPAYYHHHYHNPIVGERKLIGDIMRNGINQIDQIQFRRLLRMILGRSKLGSFREGKGVFSIKLKGLLMPKLRMICLFSMKKKNA